MVSPNAAALVAIYSGMFLYLTGVLLIDYGASMSQVPDVMVESLLIQSQNPAAVYHMGIVLTVGGVGILVAVSGFLLYRSLP